MRWALAFLIGLLVAGCGGGENDEPAARETATPTPTATATPEGRLQVAYKLPREVARRLHEHRNAYEVIREEGEVIASSDFDITTSYDVADWLRKQGIEVEDPGELTRMWLNVDEQQSLSLMIMTTDGKTADALEELPPSRRKLPAVNDVPSGGDAMLDFLRIFRLAVSEGDRRNVVVIPLQH
jgi:hypothetical protein